MGNQILDMPLLPDFGRRMGKKERLVPNEAIDWVEAAYKAVHPIQASNFRTEPGQPPPPGTLNKTEKPCNRRNLARIREVLRGTQHLSVLEVKLNIDKPVDYFWALAELLSTERKIPRDAAFSLVVYNWSGNLKVSAEEWAGVKQVSAKTAKDYLYKGRATLNRWYNEAIIKAWEGR